MEFADYPLLNAPNLTVLLLKTAAQREASIDDAVAHLRSVLRLAKENPPFSDAVFRARLRAIGIYLADAGLVQFRSGSGIAITAAGLRALSDCPAGFDLGDLVKEAEIRRRIRRRRRRESTTDPRSEKYAGGYNAYRDGRQITDNPFRQDSIDHLAWEDGWCEARDDGLLSEAVNGVGA